MLQQFTMSASLSNQPSYQLMIWCENLSRRVTSVTIPTPPAIARVLPLALRESIKSVIETGL
jgi:hypothetical protein